MCARSTLSKRKIEMIKLRPKPAGPRHAATRYGLAAIAAVTTVAVPTPAGAVECVQFVKDELAKSYPNRDFSALHGNAADWYRNAKKAYGSSVVGALPSKGAVMVFAGSGDAASFPRYASFASGSLGHVALVTKVVNGQNILVDHANWRQGLVDRNVKVTTGDNWVTASVFNLNTNAMGGNRYAVAGFISPASFPIKKK